MITSKSPCWWILAIVIDSTEQIKLIPIVRYTVMEKMGSKASIVLIVILVCLWEAILPTALYLLGLPIWLVIASAAVVVIFGIALAYYARERFHEIDEGLEDAVDNY